MRRFIVSLAVCLAALIGFSTSSARAAVRLPAIFGDHMVLQHGAPLPVWGWAEPGEEVTVQLGELRSAAVAAGPDGRWKVTLDPIPLGTRAALVVTGTNTLRIENVIAGEVWIASGQSNMQWTIKQSARAQAEIDGGNHPMIRMFNVQRAASNDPKDDVTGKWQIATPDTVAEFSAVGYHFARQLQHHLARPIGIINTSWGGTLCEAWTRLEVLEANDMFKPIVERRRADPGDHPNRAAVLYNGMIAPLIPYRIAGAIWYQGESNVGRAWQYQSLFPAMIRNWRDDWGQGEFPFLFVQLAPFRYGNNDPRLCAELWEAQLKALALPATGMAVTMDIGNPADIHPGNKQDVGKRLALWAIANTYGRTNLVHSGPLYEHFTLEGDRIRIHFHERSLGTGLATRDGQPPTHFQVAGGDMKFVDAAAEIDTTGEHSVLVRAEGVKNPVAVRYAWRDDAQPNLMNAQGLPASPFRTDNWTLLTEGQR